MKMVLLSIFVVSSILLLWVLFKNRPVVKWIGIMLIHTLVASLLLFLLNVFEIAGQYYIPINLFTVLTVAVLGLPGLIMLFSMKLFILP